MQTAPPASARLTSVDAYRGFVMFLMMAEVLEFGKIHGAIPQSGFWELLALHQNHVAWTGCVLHDLIQPSFSFLVGVALPFSLAKRIASGQPTWQRTAHAWLRAVILILLGVFLRSIDHPQTNWTFEDTLTQIGLGYGVLYWLGNRSIKAQCIGLATILVCYTAFFFLTPLAPGVTDHWALNTNAAWKFDVWFMNLFPRETPFVANEGGYSTLSFIPTLGTMILGLLIGGWLQRSDKTPGEKFRGLLIAGAGLLAIGWSIGALGWIPVVKRIWTPSWTLFSGGWCCFLLAAFYGIMEIKNLRKWAQPLLVIGMNSIAAYLIAHLFVGFISQALPRHFGADIFQSLGHPYEPLVLGGGILLVEWLMLAWMYHRKIFLRI
jgi:predicted acyltransferase